MNTNSFEHLIERAKNIRMTSAEKASMRAVLDGEIKTATLLMEHSPKYPVERRSKPRFSVRTIFYEWNPVTILIGMGTKLFDTMRK